MACTSTPAPLRYAHQRRLQTGVRGVLGPLCCQSATSCCALFAHALRLVGHVGVITAAPQSVLGVAAQHIAREGGPAQASRWQGAEDQNR